ncbi:hypothetical protein PIIN_10264 [Serendipita indica DSM 11827]|uniref:Uncharacterized protein n=1 Tax=Serendipita indica (strain DSM 11827) TaxID=1109443 RepID=G4TY76_SERID|nr:hypothetical protein PIIN_10264 [Serendipita indica DSM 11827]
MEVPCLPSIWALYLEDALPKAQARRKDDLSRLQNILVFLALSFAVFLALIQSQSQNTDENLSNLIDLTYHISLQIYNKSMPAAEDEYIGEPISKAETALLFLGLVIGFLTITTLITITLWGLLIQDSELPAAQIVNPRIRALAITRCPKYIPNLLNILYVSLTLSFLLVGAVTFGTVLGQVTAFLYLGIIVWILMAVWVMIRRERPVKEATIRFVEHLQGLNAVQEADLPVIARVSEQGVMQCSILKYTIVLHHLNTFRIHIRHQIDDKSLGWFLNHLLQYHSFPRESPKKYNLGEAELLPLLAECAADQCISGLDYVRDEDEACSHTEAREGGISALFGDLSALKHPSRIELDVIVRLVLWRNRPLDDSFRSLWQELQSGRCPITGRSYSKRLLKYANQRLRMYAITSRESDNANFIIWVTTELPLFADLVGIGDSSLSSHDKLRFCTLVCSSPWFPHYISQGYIREYIIEIMEKEAPNETPSHPYLNLCPLIDSLGRDDDDETTTARFTAFRGLTVSRAYAPHVAATYSAVSLESQVETVVSRAQNSWEA